MNAIYMTNTNVTDILANNTVPFFVNKRAGGQSAFLFLNGGVIIKKPGYYEINGTVTVTAPEAGDVVLTVQKNGVDIPGITSTETITTATTEVRTLALHGFVKVSCDEIGSIITIFNKSDIAITSSNVSFSIIG